MDLTNLTTEEIELLQQVIELAQESPNYQVWLNESQQLEVDSWHDKITSITDWKYEQRA